MARKREKVTFVTNQPFNSDVFNDYYAAIAGQKILVPIEFEVSKDASFSTYTIFGGSFIDHRGIKFDLSIGRPLVAAVDRPKQFVGFIIQYDKTKPLNFDVGLQLKEFDNLEDAKKFTPEDEQECLLMVIDTETNKIVHDLPELGKEYIKHIEDIDTQIKDAIDKELTNIVESSKETSEQIKLINEQLIEIKSNISESLQMLETKLLNRTRLTVGTKKTLKDDERVFTKVEKTDEKGQIISRSVLSRLDSEGRYTRRTVTVGIGTPEEEQYILMLKYDEDGDLYEEERI